MLGPIYSPEMGKCSLFLRNVTLIQTTRRTSGGLSFVNKCVKLRPRPISVFSVDPMYYHKHPVYYHRHPVYHHRQPMYLHRHPVYHHRHPVYHLLANLRKFIQWMDSTPQQILITMWCRSYRPLSVWRVPKGLKVLSNPKNRADSKNHRLSWHKAREVTENWRFLKEKLKFSQKFFKNDKNCSSFRFTQ